MISDVVELDGSQSSGHEPAREQRVAIPARRVAEAKLEHRVGQLRLFTAVLKNSLQIFQDD